MQADPFVLARLAARAALATTAAAAATAALQVYLDTGVAELKDDLVSLKDAEVEFGISNLTARRWAKDKNLGLEVDGRLYLSRSLVQRYKIT